MNTNCVIVNVFFALVLFPFVSPQPIATDVQPLVFLVAGVLFVLAIRNNRLRFDAIDGGFLLFALMSLVFFNPEISSFDFFTIRKTIGPMFAFLVFYAARYFGQHVSLKLLSAALVVYAVFGVLQILAPELFIQHIIDRFMSRGARTGEFDYRGITSLCPEPSFLACMALFCAVMACCAHQRKIYVTRRKMLFICVFAAALALTTKSGFALLAIGGIGISYLSARFGSLKAVLACAVLGLLVLPFHSILLKGRSAHLFSMMVEDPELLLHETSMLERVMPMIIGYHTVMSHPFGTGDVLYKDTAIRVYEEEGLGTMAIPTQEYLVRASIYAGGANEVGRYLVRMGVFFILFLAFILSRLFSVKCRLLCLMFFVFCLFTSFPFPFPPLWFLLGWNIGLPSDRLLASTGPSVFFSPASRFPTSAEPAT